MIISKSTYNAVAALAVKNRHRDGSSAAAARTLARRLQSARVLPPEEVPEGTVALGSTVQLYELGSRTRYTCRVVMPGEANPQHDKLSVLSTVGSALLGASKGETVLCRVADRVLLFRIEEIGYPPEVGGSSP